MRRTKKIDDTLQRLSSFGKDKFYCHDSIKILINFFESTKNIFSYITWILFAAPKLDPKKILEINDLDNPEWDGIMYKNLIRVERNKFIALVEPLVQAIYEKIIKKDSDLVVASLGSGSMEVEKQVLEKLIKNKPKDKPCIIIGIDISTASKDWSKENLSTLGDKIEIIEKDNLDYKFLNEIKVSLKKHTVILAKNNIFDLENNLPKRSIDLIYSCLFRHHLSDEQKTNLNKLYKEWANNVLEYDGFKSWINMIPQTIIGWDEPVFLNSEIFSNLKFPPKQKVKDILPKATIKYFNNGYYLLEYKHEFGE